MEWLAINPPFWPYLGQISDTATILAISCLKMDNSKLA